MEKEVTIVDDVQELIHEELDDWANRVVLAARENLKIRKPPRVGYINKWDGDNLISSHKTMYKSTSNVTGRLADSIRYEIRGNEVVFGMLHYGRQLNKGSNGKPVKVSMKSIEEWIRNKRSFQLKNVITGRRLPKSRENIRTAAFLISRSKSKHPQTGTFFMDRALKYTE